MNTKRKFSKVKSSKLETVSGIKSFDIYLSIFSVNTYFPTYTSESLRSTMKFVNTIHDFRQNMQTRFFSDKWFDAIDLEKFVIFGGCVVNALCQSPFPDTQMQDINIVYISNSAEDCRQAIESIIQRLRIISARYSHHQVKVEKTPGVQHYDVFLPCGVKLNFTYVHDEHSTNAISRMLYTLDMDVSQVAFTGNFIINTPDVSRVIPLC